MCNKQCRDENGFKVRPRTASVGGAARGPRHTVELGMLPAHSPGSRTAPLPRRSTSAELPARPLPLLPPQCHCMSESHQRQMQMFSENSGRYMDEFSVAFEEGMLEIIARKARSQRVQANVLYRDYIADRNHTHMNSTIWETLTDFVMYLGRTGKCEVDETEKGWFVTYIDRDPEKLRRLEERAKRERTELDSEERHERDLLRQAKVARAAVGDDALASAATELRRENPDQKVALAMGSGLVSRGKPKLAVPSCSAFGVGDEEEPSDGHDSAGGASGVGAGAAAGIPRGGKAPAIASLIAEETRRKESAGRKEYWVVPGLVVKVLNKKLKEGKYYKQKGTIEKERQLSL